MRIFSSSARRAIKGNITRLAREPSLAYPLDQKFRDLDPAMHRLTARLLLVLLLVGTLAPVALAISAPLPHACCMRKPMHDHGSRNLEFQAVGGEHHNCCPPVTTAHWAELGSTTNTNTHPPLAYLPLDSRPIVRHSFENVLRPVRGPPLA